MSSINGYFIMIMAASLAICLTACGEIPLSQLNNSTGENNSDIIKLYEQSANDGNQDDWNANNLDDNNDDAPAITYLGGDLSEIEDTLTSPLDNYAYLGSYDSRIVASYGNGTMELFNMMDNNLGLGLDGTLQKTHNAALYSRGSELLTIDEITSFSGYDLLGNQYSSRKMTSLTLSNFDYPFALLSNEMILLDANDLDWKGTQTQNYLLLPEMSGDMYSQISDILANTGSTRIISFNETTDPLVALNSAGFDLSQVFGKDEMDKFMAPLRNKEMWDVIREMAQQEVDRQKKEAERDIATDFSASSGGITCIWGYRE